MNAAKWEQIPLGQCCEVFSGFPFKSDGFTDNEDDVHLVKGENIGQGQVLWGISKRWPREDATALERYRLVAGDVVLAMDRPWVPAGLKFARIPESAPDAWLVQRAARLRANAMMTQPFLACLIGSPDFTSYIQNVGRGVGVPHISGRQICAYPVCLPPLKEQQRIAEVLTTYDALMENNRRRMALLEEAARQLYAEWFVRLRYPGHARTRRANLLPKGWRTVPFSDLAAFVNGYPFKPAELGFDGLPVVKIPELRSGVTDKTPKNPGEDISEKYLLKDGDLLFSWSGTLLIEFWYDGPAILNQHLFRVEPTELCSAAFLLFALRDALPQFTNQTVGATMKHIRKAALTTVTTVLPPRALLAQFDEVASVVFRQILNLRKQTQKLRTARDLLLPRLMSGELAV